MAYAFVLGYHGCDKEVGERILAGEAFKQSDNDYDWLGPGIYFWEANPRRGLEFALEASRRRNSSIKTPCVIGAIIDLGSCLDLTTSLGIQAVRLGYASLVETSEKASTPIPTNHPDRLRRFLDCAVIRRVHEIFDGSAKSAKFETVRGIFTEGEPAFPGALIPEKTHTQIAVRSFQAIKGVFRVPTAHLDIDS